MKTDREAPGKCAICREPAVHLRSRNVARFLCHKHKDEPWDPLAEITRLRKMLQWCAEQTWEGPGDIDWCDFQEAMVKAGFYVLVPTPEEFKEFAGDEMYVVSWSPLAKGKEDG